MRGEQDDNVDLRAYEAYVEDNPGRVREPVMLRPSREQVLLLVVTDGDPAPVDKALRPAYGDQLCVVRARFSRAEISRAEAALGMGDRGKGPEGALSWGRAVARDGQPQLQVEVTRVDAALARRVAALPEGIVRVDPWLRHADAPPERS